MVGESSVGARKIDFNQFIYVLHLFRVVGGNGCLEATDTLVKKVSYDETRQCVDCKRSKKTKNRRIAVILFYCKRTMNKDEFLKRCDGLLTSYVSNKSYIIE